jgi:hypothetical protein
VLVANHDRWFVVTFLALAVGFPLVYLSQPLHFDEAIYLAVAEQVANGQTLYVDIADHKPPGIFLIGVAAFELFSEPLRALRLLTYAVTAVSGLLVFELGRQLRDRRVGMIASLLYLVMVYLPHFDGFFFLTEPWAVLTLLAAALWLLDDRAITDALAGASLGIGVLFNQTVFLFGAAIITVHALKLRYPNFRTREYVYRSARRILTIGVGFLCLLAVAFGALYLNGILEATLFYSAYVPLVGYSTPFDLYQHVLALLSLFPVWLLAGWMLLGTGIAIARGRVLSDEHLLVASWGAILSIPGAMAFAGDHKFLFAFPALALLATVALFDGWARFGRNPLRIRDFLGRFPSRSTLLTVLFLVSVVGAAGVNVVYAQAVLDTDMSVDAADARDIAAHADGPVYMYPPGNHVFYFTDDIRPVSTWIGQPYADVLVDQTVTDLDQRNVQYVAVLRSYTSEDGTIEAKDRYWAETKEPLVGYLNRNYEPVERTDQYVIYRRAET